ncbi:MAG: fibrobacter succinogenes major paralogous domain-containing protein, partial [Mediterranea sp.]|nr:fibrobacter succinogenes major paralogous domain-containing protein [Mediterranea sp.]
FAGTGTSTDPDPGTGLFYQWGRKDPFPATGKSGDQQAVGSFTAVATSSTNGTIVNTIQNPSVFLTAGPSSDYDWLYAARDSTLWGHSADHSAPKTIYDPCPAGWRVPVNSVGDSNDTSLWYGFAKDDTTTPANIVDSFSYGYNWGDNALYPAAESHGYSSGTLSGIGTLGRYWSASPYSSSSNYASDLYFRNGTVSVSSNGNRAFGCSVRCVKE